MSIMEAVQSVFSNYANFNGRARRSEYWWFCLANFVIALILSTLGRKISLFGFVSGLYSLAVLIPAIAVGVRRLHDIGKSGWWLFISLVPVIGSIILIVSMAKDSEPGENQYGPNPKESF